MPRTIESNWLELYRNAVAQPGYPGNQANYDRLTQNPGIRQHEYGGTGVRFNLPLSALAAVDTTLNDSELGQVPGMEDRFRRHSRKRIPGFGQPLCLVIADGATVPIVTGTFKVALYVHRGFGTSEVFCRLFWPKFRYDLWRFFRYINWGSAIEREAALRGEL